METARSFFRPEFLNRIDDFVVFQPLDGQQITRIVQLQVGGRLWCWLHQSVSF